jgi:hypothetical protein
MCYYSGKTKIDFHQKSKIWSYGEVPQLRVHLFVISHISRRSTSVIHHQMTLRQSIMKAYL